MKNNRTFLEKLLDGAEVEWKTVKSLCNDNFWLMPATPEFDDNGTIPYITSKNIKGGKIDFQNTKYINEHVYQELSRTRCIIENDILISMIGTIGEAVIVKKEDLFFYGQNMYILRLNNKLVNHKFFLYYFTAPFILNSLLSKKNSSNQGYLKAGQIENLKIPIPPLSVQTEIVKILDALTALTSELTSELTLRRKQYEYYREKLLSHNDSENLSQQKVDKDKLFSTSNIQWLHLNEIYKFQYGIGNKIPTIGGEYPVYGSNGIVGSHNEYNSEDAPVIGHIGAYAGIVNWAEGKHFVTYNGIICNKINDNVNSRYAYYLLLSQNFIDKANKASQPFISYDILNKCIVPVPPIEEQHRIVSILDKFETLTNSITEGLPLAIEQSQNRYEYYRELLLNFS